MTNRSFEIVLAKDNRGTFVNDALALPKARLAGVSDADGNILAFSVNPDATVQAASGSEKLFGRLELIEDLVAQSSLDQAKLKLDSEKLRIEEHANRRTLWSSVATAVLTAAASIAVAFIANLGGGKPTPKVYYDLVDCRENLTALRTLAQLDQQTVPKLREAITRSVDSCSERLNTAITASKP